MKPNSIITLVEAFAKPSKMLDSKLSDITEAAADVVAEAKHYGITEKKMAKMTLRETLDEINRRRTLAESKG